MPWRKDSANVPPPVVRGLCHFCEKKWPLTADGRLTKHRAHASDAEHCRGSRKDPLVQKLAHAVRLLAELISESDCRFDHNGTCQEHNVLRGEQCPHAEAKAFLASLKEQ